MTSMRERKHAQTVLDKRNRTVTEPIVIFVASSTPEKCRDLQLIAESKGYPIIFEDVHKLVTAFHHVDETGKEFNENANAKVEGVGVEKYRNGEYKERIDNYLKERKLNPNSKVFIATEDSGFRLPKAIWEKFDKTGIPQEVLDRITSGKNPEFTGPGVETAPILNAVLGDYNFMRRIYKAAESLGIIPKDIPEEQKGKEIIPKIDVIQNSVLHLEPVRGYIGDSIDFTAEISNNIIFRPLAETKKKLSQRKVTNYDYMLKDGIDKTFGELAGEGIIEHSVRSQLAADIYAKLFQKEISEGYQPNYKPAFRQKPYDKPFKIGTFDTTGEQIIARKMEDLLSEPDIAQHFSLAGNDQLTALQKLKKSGYEILGSIEKTLAGSDSILLMPDMHKENGDKKNAEEVRLAELMKIYTLSSLVVNKQLNPRDADKPVIVLNHDGSWNNAIKIHTSLANLAMTKEHALTVPRKFLNPNNIDYKTNGYFEVVGTPNGKVHSYEETLSTAMELLKEARKGYFAGHLAASQEFQQGDEHQGDGKFKVAIFCSANSENKYLNESVKNLSYDLAQHDFGIIYGAGDRYTMGAVLDGVKEWREKLAQNHIADTTYIAGYSTKPLLKSETKKGTFSEDLNFAKQDRDIYQRMDDMLASSDVVVAAPGGAGTLQEWAAALILNHSRPKEEKKPVVFFDPELNKNAEKRQVWKVALKAVLGEKDYKLLTSNTESIKKQNRCEELGIYVEKTEEAVNKRIEMLEEKHRRLIETHDFSTNSGVTNRINTPVSYADQVSRRHTGTGRTFH